MRGNKVKDEFLYLCAILWSNIWAMYVVVNTIVPDDNGILTKPVLLNWFLFWTFNEVINIFVAQGAGNSQRSKLEVWKNFTACPDLHHSWLFVAPNLSASAFFGMYQRWQMISSHRFELIQSWGNFNHMLQSRKPWNN